MDALDTPPSNPPPPPPKRFSRPKITIQMPDNHTPAPLRGPPTGAIFWNPAIAGQKFNYRPPGTPISHISDPHVNPYYNPFVHMYQNKASDFMFKQFNSFKDFTMNTAKSGLSVGEKTAFWFYNKLSLWSKKWFTHFFLMLCLVLYSVMGAGIFMFFEGPNEDKYDKSLDDVRKKLALRVHEVLETDSLAKENTAVLLQRIQLELMEYEANYTECIKHINNNNSSSKTWTFWNSMFYAGTIYTTIGKTPTLTGSIFRTNLAPK